MPLIQARFNKASLFFVEVGDGFVLRHTLRRFECTYTYFATAATFSKMKILTYCEIIVGTLS